MASLKNVTINDTGYITVPSGTTAQRPASPVAGMFRYNTDLGCTEYYNGSAWINPAIGQPQLITNGLQIYLDPANSQSCPYTGTTVMYDLSGNGNFVYTNNTPTYSPSNYGTFTMDGTSQWFNNASPVLPTGTSNSTILVWCKPDSTGPTNSYTGLFSYGGRTSSNSRLLSLSTNGTTMYVSSAYWGNDYVPNNLAVTANAWNMVGLATIGTAGSNNTTLISGNAAGGGVNTVTGSSSNSGTNLATTSVNLAIGCTDYPGRYFKGQIGIVLMYNRVLTSAELTYLYNITKSKYGL